MRNRMYQPRKSYDEGESQMIRNILGEFPPEDRQGSRIKGKGKKLFASQTVMDDVNRDNNTDESSMYFLTSIEVLNDLVERLQLEIFGNGDLKNKTDKEEAKGGQNEGKKAKVNLQKTQLNLKKQNRNNSHQNQFEVRGSISINELEESFVGNQTYSSSFSSQKSDYHHQEDEASFDIFSTINYSFNDIYARLSTVCKEAERQNIKQKQAETRKEQKKIIQQEEQQKLDCNLTQLISEKNCMYGQLMVMKEKWGQFEVLSETLTQENQTLRSQLIEKDRQMAEMSGELRELGEVQEDKIGLISEVQECNEEITSIRRENGRLREKLLEAEKKAEEQTGIQRKNTQKMSKEKNDLQLQIVSLNDQVMNLRAQNAVQRKRQASLIGEIEQLERKFVEIEKGVTEMESSFYQRRSGDGKKRRLGAEKKLEINLPSLESKKTLILLTELNRFSRNISSSLMKDDELFGQESKQNSWGIINFPSINQLSSTVKKF